MRKTGDAFGSIKVSRRDFGRSIAGLGITGAIANAIPSLAKPESVAIREGEQNPSSNQNSNRECDVLIKGGTVIDPSQQMHAVLDVAVKDGKILEVSQDFPEARARTVVWAKDKIVTPGFLDIYAHVFVGGTRNSVNADLNCLVKGVTTVVDTSTGWPMIDGLRKYVIDTSTTRVYALLEIGMLGDVSNYRVMENLAWVNPELTANAARENKSAVVGISVYLGDSQEGTKDLELECLKRTAQAAEDSGLPMMVRYHDLLSPLPAILNMMRRGDVLTHIYNREKVGILDANGKILPEVREARQRGVLFDVGHGLVHFVYDYVEKCLQQDFLPDTISTTLVAPHPYKHYEVSTDLPTIVSEFLALGLDLDKAIAMVTAKPAKVFNYGVELGTLRPGREADISVFEVREGQFTFVDYTGDTRTGRQRLFPVAAMRSGKLFEAIEQFYPGHPRGT